jgi:hypothetical protein
MHASPAALILTVILLVLVASRFAPPQAWWRSWLSDLTGAALLAVIVLLLTGLLW